MVAFKTCFEYYYMYEPQTTGGGMAKGAVLQTKCRTLLNIPVEVRNLHKAGLYCRKQLKLFISDDFAVYVKSFFNANFKNDLGRHNQRKHKGANHGNKSL